MIDFKEWDEDGYPVVYALEQINPEDGDPYLLGLFTTAEAARRAGTEADRVSWTLRRDFQGRPHRDVWESTSISWFRGETRTLEVHSIPVGKTDVGRIGSATCVEMP